MGLMGPDAAAGGDRGHNQGGADQGGPIGQASGLARRMLSRQEERRPLAGTHLFRENEEPLDTTAMISDTTWLDYPEERWHAG